MEDIKVKRIFQQEGKHERPSEQDADNLKVLQPPKKVFVATSSLRDVIHPGYGLVYLYSGQHSVREKKKTLLLATDSKLMAVYNGFISEVAKLARLKTVEINHQSAYGMPSMVVFELADDSPPVTVSRIRKISFILNTITVKPFQYWAYCQECDGVCGDLWQTDKSIAGNTGREVVFIHRLLKGVEVKIKRSRGFETYGKL